jgi:hypothetical protein
MMKMNKKRPGSPFGDPGLLRHRRLGAGPQRGSHAGVKINESEVAGDCYVSFHRCLRFYVLRNFIALFLGGVKEGGETGVGGNRKREAGGRKGKKAVRRET